MPHSPRMQNSCLLHYTVIRRREIFHKSRLQLFSKFHDGVIWRRWRHLHLRPGYIPENCVQIAFPFVRLLDYAKSTISASNCTRRVSNEAKSTAALLLLLSPASLNRRFSCISAGEVGHDRTRCSAVPRRERDRRLTRVIRRVCSILM